MVQALVFTFDGVESLLFDCHFVTRFVHTRLTLCCDTFFCARHFVRKSELIDVWLICSSMTSTVTLFGVGVFFFLPPCVGFDMTDHLECDIQAAF